MPVFSHPCLAVEHRCHHVAFVSLSLVVRSYEALSLQDQGVVLSAIRPELTHRAMAPWWCVATYFGLAPQSFEFIGWLLRLRCGTGCPWFCRSLGARSLVERVKTVANQESGQLGHTNAARESGCHFAKKHQATWSCYKARPGAGGPVAPPWYPPKRFWMVASTVLQIQSGSSSCL